MSVDIIPQSDFLRIEWKTSEPGRSKIFIWPTPTVSGHKPYLSPSDSSGHYVNVSYDNLSLYPEGNVVMNDYLKYYYRIEATNKEEIFAEKTGEFNLGNNLGVLSNSDKNSIASGIHEQCGDLFSNKLTVLFCKNYRIYNDLLSSEPPPPPFSINVSNITSTSAKISRNATVGADSYTLHKSNNTDWQFATDILNGTEYTAINLFPDTTYHYRLRSKNEYGLSSSFTSITFKTSAAP